VQLRAGYVEVAQPHGFAGVGRVVSDAEENAGRRISFDMMAGMKNTTIIEDAWRSYKSAVFLQELPDLVFAAHRATFFSGAGIVFKALFPEDAPAVMPSTVKWWRGSPYEIQLI